MLRDLGPLGLLCLVLGAVGALLALVTLVLLAAKRRGGSMVVGLLCLVTAGGALALGALGYAVGMTAVRASLANVPFGMKAELLLKGTLEARVNLLVALVAASFPWLVGSIAMLLTRFRVGMGLAVVVALGLASSLAAHERPLPPGKVEVARVEGLQLPPSIAQRRPGAQPLIALTAAGLWVDGAKVSSLGVALEDPRVREQNPDVLVLSVDGRVAFSELVQVLEEAGRAKRHEFDLVVQSPDGELAVIRIADAQSVPPDAAVKSPLLLTLRVTGKEVEVLAVGGALDPLPLDWRRVQDKLVEVKALFPDETSLRLTAAPEVPLDVLVKAMDASRETEQSKWLFPDVVIGRFDSPVVPSTVGAIGVPVDPEGDSGEVDREKLAAYVRARKAAIQQCYEKELKHAPTLKGKVVVLFSITPSGRTSAVEIEQNTLGSEAVGDCIKATVRGWVLPFRPASDVPIAYPFVFAPAG